MRGWSSQAEWLIRTPIRHVYSVAFTTSAGSVLPVEVTACEVTLDEGWSPYCQATITARRPDLATLDALDPRGRITVTVSAGYVLPGAVRDEHTLAVLYLSSRIVELPENTVILQAQGPEYLFDDAHTLAASQWGGTYPAWSNSTAARDAVQACLGAAGATAAGFTFDYTDAVTSRGWAEDDDGEAWSPQIGDSPLDLARDIAYRVEAHFYADELGAFHLERPSSSQANAVHRLRVGVDGTIIRATGEVSREGWANGVLVIYRWRTEDGLDKVAAGSARYSGSAHGTTVAGSVIHQVEIEHKGSTSAARARARSGLRARFNRGRSFGVDAVAAYWLRPDDAVSITSTEQTYLAVVSSITFRLDTGEMTLTTRDHDTGLIPEEA